jgi:hypothetical protein
MFSLFVTLVTASAFAQSNNQLINWFAGADIVGTTGSDDINQDSDFYVREFEISAYSAIDHTWNGVLTLSNHKESTSSESHTEVHEAFIHSSKLIDLSTLKVGKFFLGFGRLNRFHRHDWAFTEAALVQKSFFGNEGVKDSGVEYTRNLPGIMSSLTIGVTKGDEFNHSHEHEHEGTTEANHVDRAKSPTAYVRFAKFFEISTSKGFEIALNHINRLDAHSVAYKYNGLDFTYKERAGKMIQTLVQAEIWQRNTVHEEETETERFNDIGGYLYLEKGLDQHHAIGLKFDYYKPDSHVEEAGDDHEHGIDGIEVDKEYRGLGLSYIYTNSEFMKTRFTIDHANGVKVDTDDSVDSFTKGTLQFVFSIGAHPAHVF